MHEQLERINGITEKIIGCAFRVSNTLGIGYLEKVYENALAYELRKSGLSVRQQVEINDYMKTSSWGLSRRFVCRRACCRGNQARKVN